MDVTKTEEAALAEFMEYFRKNYPGPETIIGKPDWHSPKIFRAARHALFTPTALAADPAVKALVAEAVAAERARCVEIAVRHWEGEPEDTIAMAAEMLVGMTSLTEYERKVTQMRENFPNGI